MCITSVRRNHTLQTIMALGCGIAFGFLLEKGQVANYNVIIGQLLFRNFTVIKVMGSAVITGMLGIYIMHVCGLITLHPKQITAKTAIIGGIIFGVGFGLLGYCPGTIIAAAAHGALDALIGGIPGIILGSMLFAHLYKFLQHNCKINDSPQNIFWIDLLRRHRNSK